MPTITKIERLQRMLAALSAVNTAVVEATTREALSRGICAALIETGLMISATFLSFDQVEDRLRVEATSGPSTLAVGDMIERTGHRWEMGREGRIEIRDVARMDKVEVAKLGIAAEVETVAMFPVLGDGRVHGELVAGAAHRSAFDEETTGVVGRAAASLSFGLRVFDDAHALAAAFDRMRVAAFHDSMTGLPNRAGFDAALLRETDDPDGNHRQFALLFIDFDGFKTINDELGHAAGDGVLIEMADRIRRALREGESAARIGGDEFAVIVPGANGAARAARLAEDLLPMLSAPFNVSGHLRFVTASIGVASSRSFVDRAPDILHEADMAMYAAKRAGKNGFHIHPASAAGLARVR